MKRLLTVGFVAAALLSAMLVMPGAQAAPRGAQSASCSLVAKLKFRPPLQEGMNDFAFIKIYAKVRGCSGGLVSTGHMIGGSEGDLRCESGVLGGRAAAKARIDWDTGDQSGLNWIFAFGKSRLRGKVVSGLFKDDRIFARFSVTAVRGLCQAGDPLEYSKLRGALKL